MERLLVFTVVASFVMLYFMWMPSMGIDVSVRGPAALRSSPGTGKMLYSMSVEPTSSWPEIRETITWVIGTVNGVMLIAAAVNGRKRRKSR
ncbi:MAG: hypothetical protein WCP22_03325 [Chlamydiota bacterium]